MREDQFQTQMNRLLEQFGKSAYGTERCKLIWKEVQHLDSFWFARIIDKFIGEYRQAPLLTEFREEITKERERIWQLEKKQNQKAAREFFDGTYAPEDKKTICDFIQKRLRNEVSDPDYSTFLKHLDYAAKSVTGLNQRISCKTCNDSGLVFHRDDENYEWVYRCFCLLGDKQPRSYPRFGFEQRSA